MIRTRILGAPLLAAVLGAAGWLLATPSPASASLTGFKAVQGSYGWVDFTGDGRADTCYLGDIGPTCRAATTSGFGATWALWNGDAGWSAGRAWADFNGDRRADYCRVVGSWNRMLQCSVSNGSGWGGTYTSWAVDGGYDAGRAWADVTGDGRADYCPVVGWSSYQIQCTPSTGAGFGTTFTSGNLDPGYDQGRTWVDVNGDSRADYCRVVGAFGKYLQCTLSTGSGFGVTITSAEMDPGYDDSRRWADVNGDGRADYCRIVGSFNYAQTNVRCTLSIGTGFGLSFTSTAMDAGYGGTGMWADVTGDSRDDYCRQTDGYAGTCTISLSSSFGSTFSTPITSYNMAGWVDYNADGMADLCRWEADAPRCTVSTGYGFGPTYG